MTAPLVVLGVGNLLMGDDGVGVRAVRTLTARPDGLPPGTRILDGGTGGLHLLPEISDAGALLVVDAVDVRAAPGSIHVLTGSDLYADLVRLSVHQVGVSDLLAAIRLTRGAAPRTALVGVQPASLELGVRLSPVVESALPLLLQTVHTWSHRLVSTMEIVS